MRRSRRLFVTADDRTGALEIGGIVATDTFQVPVGPNADSSICSVVDIESRHLPSAHAFQRMYDVHGRAAEFRCHKMDSGLRGNWPHECRALVERGYKVAVVPSFPDAGRRCKEGVVYIDDVPLLESPFGADPFAAPCSSRPDEVLNAANCAMDGIAIWDANTNRELEAAVVRCLDERRVLVGPTGAIGAFARMVMDLPVCAQLAIEKPVLVVCGSLNAISRSQLERLACPVHGLGDQIEFRKGLAIVATPVPTGSISGVEAVHMAGQLARIVHKLSVKARTLLLIGGDTTASVVRNETLMVNGLVDTGIPIAEFRDRLLVTKGGGIGTLDTLVNLCTNAN